MLNRLINRDKTMPFSAFKSHSCGKEEKRKQKMEKMGLA
jgi:hypothetical protein